MTSKAAAPENAFYNIGPIIYLAAMANLFVGALGAAVFGLYNIALAPHFLAGYVMGIANIYLLLRLSQRLNRLSPQKAGSYMLRNYYIRFFVSACVLAVLIYMGISPWALVAGIAASITTTTTIIIIKAREGLKDA
ncbi:MAG: hypothetical protein AABZ23_05125 [Deltaproteobacteria bacterium]